ncbi:uncharacterized protein LOC125868610 [Solanum stenotomum]|uniref:uncharacterized protein LOC125868610 n=1 Tax=Solanum stenotomum TaxID=172797 RepID=UPI0020D1E823|nr:uncharacterized protein LOC125868610 [Solanum stenotomum]
MKAKEQGKDITGQIGAKKLKKLKEGTKLETIGAFTCIVIVFTTLVETATTARVSTTSAAIEFTLGTVPGKVSRECTQSESYGVGGSRYYGGSGRGNGGHGGGGRDGGGGCYKCGEEGHNACECTTGGH